MFLAMALIWQQAGGGILGTLSGLFPLLLVVGLFYFMIIVPQRKRQRETQEMLNALKSGDRVVTTGGIYGVITAVNDAKRTVNLRVAESPNVRLEIERSAIARLQESAPEEKK
jgi:preprotein translocase subunit YajC